MEITMGSVTPKRNFTTDLEEARKAELRIHEFFRRRGYDIEDRADDKDSQGKGIDFDFIKNGVILSGEVKSDNRIHSTGNIFVEHKMVRSTGHFDGWMHYCKADILFYHDFVNDCVYMLDWPKLKEVVKDFPWRAFTNPTDYETRGYGYLVPVEEAKKLGLVKLTCSLVGIETPKE